MDWIFENFQVVVFIFVAVVWALRSLFGKKPDVDETPGAPAHRRGQAEGEDPAEAERTRQIQEEIRRRILARQRGEVSPSPAAPPPLASPPPVIVYQETEREPAEVLEPEFLEEGPRTPMPTAAARRQEHSAQAAILEQQRLLAEQLHALRAARAAGTMVAPVPPLSLSRNTTATIAAHQRSCVRELRRDLRETSSLRRAILLREILGEPLALRRGTALPRR